MKQFLQKVGLGLTAAALTFSSVVMPAQAITISTADVGTSTYIGNGDYRSMIKSIVNIVIVVAALLTFFYLVWGAINWITSGGDKGKVEEARNKITAAVIGLLILAATWAIFQLIMTIAFGGNLAIESLNG
ncbi:hypothetical protein IJJ27_03920 [bacterium]|nr:hypothetical protein [bacterium]MBQ6436675.1 hypothetical protein [bacterium]